MVEMAIGNCDRLVRLVNDILDFDSVEKGMLALEPAPVEGRRPAAPRRRRGLLRGQPGAHHFRNRRADCRSRCLPTKSAFCRC
jgi:signal transduction histidine kinase